MRWFVACLDQRYRVRRTTIDCSDQSEPHIRADTADSTDGLHDKRHAYEHQRRTTARGRAPFHSRVDDERFRRSVHRQRASRRSDACTDHPSSMKSVTRRASGTQTARTTSCFTVRAARATVPLQRARSSTQPSPINGRAATPTRTTIRLLLSISRRCASRNGARRAFGASRNAFGDALELFENRDS